MAKAEHNTVDLNEREQQILKVLVEDYIQKGQPLGSRTLAKRSGLSLSAATIRNVMSDLEERGYIIAPHTSAGRIPTSQGYRFFVDSLLHIKPLESSTIDSLRQRFSLTGNPQNLIRSASGLLSGVTQLTSIVSIPRRKNIALKQIEFLRLSSRRVLAVLVLERQEIQNRILLLDRDYSASELQQFSNYLNSLLAGKNLHAVRDTLLHEMQQVRIDMNEMMLSAIKLGEQAFHAEDSRDETQDECCVIAGETHLMDYDDLSDLDKLRQLFQAFNEKRQVLHLLDRCLNSDGVKIFIGNESQHDVFNACSLVSAPYSIEGQVVGVLGVIGPKRMPYEQVIPIVDITAQLLGTALKSKN